MSGRHGMAGAMLAAAMLSTGIAVRPVDSDDFWATDPLDNKPDPLIQARKAAAFYTSEKRVSKRRARRLKAKNRAAKATPHDPLIEKGGV